MNKTTEQYIQNADKKSAQYHVRIPLDRSKVSTEQIEKSKYFITKDQSQNVAGWLLSDDPEHSLYAYGDDGVYVSFVHDENLLLSIDSAWNRTYNVLKSFYNSEVAFAGVTFCSIKILLDPKYFEPLLKSLILPASLGVKPTQLLDSSNATYKFKKPNKYYDIELSFKTNNQFFVMEVYCGFSAQAPFEIQESFSDLNKGLINETHHILDSYFERSELFERVSLPNLQTTQ